MCCIQCDIDNVSSHYLSFSSFYSFRFSFSFFIIICFLYVCVNVRAVYLDTRRDDDAVCRKSIVLVSNGYAFKLLLFAKLCFINYLPAVRC